MVKSDKNDDPFFEEGALQPLLDPKNTDGVIFTRVEIAVLRLLCAHSAQLRPNTFSAHEFRQHVAHHVPESRLMLNLFHVRFCPNFSEAERKKKTASAKKRAKEAIAKIRDKNCRETYDFLFKLVCAGLRTNAYQEAVQSGALPLAFKVSPADIKGVKKPHPYRAIFVYHKHIEGIHLRGGAVARGGIRWTDRAKDYRTEVLALQQTQNLKNTIIVPTGAKGGFLPKQLTADMNKAEQKEIARHAYTLFVKALLSITDNKKTDGDGAEVIMHPDQTVRHDGDDTYLVMAADKGTATFSDTANAIAKEAGFWLNDAFASGGSQGYDHKKMGITAKGAWESVKHHLAKKGINPETDRVSLVGIGGMAGDVFGNGLLLSETIQMKAAFNHTHIFIDPTPSMKKSFQERKRLFKAGLSWESYDQSKISVGGGVFSRKAESIPLTAEMRLLFGIKDQCLTPNALIRHILTLDVDVMWHGGIGTFIKASYEKNNDVMDSVNDDIRVSATDVRATCMGEGANLAITQAGRIELAQHGVMLNTDAVDNSGGVDCSDHEVNLKLLFAEMMEQKKLTHTERNRWLRQMAPDVEALVLANNKAQNSALDKAQKDDTQKLLKWQTKLADLGYVDVKNHTLPTAAALKKRTLLKKGETTYTRPELAILMSATKQYLTDQYTEKPIKMTTSNKKLLLSYFPQSLQKAFPEACAKHPLQQALLAMLLANKAVNDKGILKAVAL